MWGWKAEERNIEPSVSLDQAKAIMEEAGFTERVANPQHAIYKQTGTQFTTKGGEFPIEVALVKSKQGLFLQARYDTFTLFDTGDLKRFVDDLAGKLGTCP